MLFLFQLGHRTAGNRSSLQNASRSPYLLICIFTDSLAAIHSIIQYAPTAYSHRIVPMQKKWEKTVIFQWIPSHCGIFGNEMGDKIAETATKLFPQSERLISLNKAIFNAHFSKYWTTMWLTSENGKALKKSLKKPNNCTATFHSTCRHLHQEQELVIQ